MPGYVLISSLLTSTSLGTTIHDWFSFSSCAVPCDSCVSLVIVICGVPSLDLITETSGVCQWRFFCRYLWQWKNKFGGY